MSINPQTSNSRIEFIDLLRMIAILSVVLCHATEKVYHLNLRFMESIPFFSRVAGLSLFTCGRLGVPLFLMITGYLLLDKEYDKRTTVHFYKKKWMHLLVCTWIWIIIYAVFRCLVFQIPVNYEEVLKELVFIHKIPMSHAWYLIMILGLYIFVPFVARVLKAFPKNIVVLLILLAVFFALIYPVLNVINNVTNPAEPLAGRLFIDFSGGAYGLCLIFGYLIKKKVFHDINKYLAAIIMMGSFAAAVYLQIWSYSKGVVYKIWYNNIFIVLAPLGLFELLSRINKVYCYSVVREIAYYSFPIYLIHMMVIMAFDKYIHCFPVMRSLHVAVLWMASFGVSFLFAWLINRIPLVGKFILYTK